MKGLEMEIPKTEQYYRFWPNYSTLFGNILPISILVEGKWIIEKYWDIYVLKSKNVKFFAK
jgi:hypothetical protein